MTSINMSILSNSISMLYFNYIKTENKECWTFFGDANDYHENF